MNTLLAHLRIFLGLLLPAPVFATAVIWVSPDGNDRADGTQERPFATLSRARDAVRERVGQGLRDDVAIRLRGGVYRLEETLELTSADLGDGSYMITLAGHPGEKVVVSGARLLPSAWRSLGNGHWVLTLPEARNGAWTFRSLFRGRVSLPRAREPDVGFYTVADVTEERRRLFLHESLPEEWSAIEGAEVNSVAHWHFNRQPVAAIDSRSITGKRGIGTDVSGARITARSHSRVWLENALPFVDTPGEWYLDTEKGELHYRAAEGEDPNTQAFSAPVLRELLVVKGTAERVVRNLHIRGIEFAETDWEMPAEGRLGVQAGAWAFDRERTYSPSAAIRFVYAWDTAIEHCRFRDLGDGAISFEIGTRGGLVSQCDFERVGSNVIQIGRMPEYTGQGHPMHRDFADTRSLIDESGVIPNAQEMWERSKRLAPESPAQIKIVDNRFVDCGHLDYGSVAVGVGYASHVTIAHNFFRNLPYSAISVGWRWAPGLSNCHSNIVHRNRIEKVMQQAGDGAAIYLVGEQPGTRVTDNFIRDSGRNYWAHGIYPDEFSDHMVISGNYIMDVMDHAIFMHKNGPNQDVRDNNGESGRTAITGRTERGTQWSKFIPERAPPDLSIFGPRRATLP